MRLVKTLSFILAVTGVTLVAQPSGSFSNMRISASSTWADNLSRTSHLPTLKSGQYFTASAAMDYVRDLDGSSLLVATGELVGQNTPKFDALNSLTGNGTLKLRRKFGLGPYAPVVEAYTGLSDSQFNESDRSGWAYTYGARVSKRLTHALSLAAGAQWDDYFGNHSVYDVTSHRVTLEGNWDLTDRWRISLGGARIWGEFIANASPKIWPLALSGQLGPEIFQHYNTLAWEVSDTFGPGWVAYRNRDSTINQWWCELSPALNDRTSLSLRYEFARASNGIGIEYDASFWTVGINHQF